VAINDTDKESIIFLGTGGARMMVSNQTLASGGIWLKLNGTEVLLDPGPGSIVRVTDRKLKPEKLSAVIVSHRHIDHSSDVNIMIEAMTVGGSKPHGWFYSPADAVDNEPVIYSYLRKRLDGLGILKEGGSYSINGLSFSTPLLHIHQVETYGITFQSRNHTISYITDTLYFDELLSTYKSDLLIINVLLMQRIPGVLHLSIPDVKLILLGLKPKVAILTHFGPHLYESNPIQIAEKLTEETGVKVIAALDGMEFDLSELDRL
jgi:ribonuclease BN (tRNA processing enzyme)